MFHLEPSPLPVCRCQGTGTARIVEGSARRACPLQFDLFHWIRSARDIMLPSRGKRGCSYEAGIAVGKENRDGLSLDGHQA